MLNIKDVLKRAAFWYKSPPKAFFIIIQQECKESDTDGSNPLSNEYIM